MGNGSWAMGHALDMGHGPWANGPMGQWANGPWPRAWRMAGPWAMGQWAMAKAVAYDATMDHRRWPMVYGPWLMDQS